MIIGGELSNAVVLVVSAEMSVSSFALIMKPLLLALRLKIIINVEKLPGGVICVKRHATTATWTGAK